MFEANRSNRWITALAACTIVLPFGGLLAAAEARATAPADAPPAEATASTDLPIPAAPPTTAAAPTTTPPTTAPPTTAPPAPTTTTPQAPRPVSAPPSPPAPTPAAAPARTPAQTIQAAYESAVPAAWRNALPVRLTIIPGTTSWGHASGLIEIAESLLPRWGLLRTTIAHEVGHVIAYHYGSQASSGAAPTGWPAYSDMPVEGWADCVAWAFTGIADPSHGLPPCPSASLSWTADWLARGPAAHPRTR